MRSMQRAVRVTTYIYVVRAGNQYVPQFRKEFLSVILGHRSIHVDEDHYLPVITSLQGHKVARPFVLYVRYYSLETRARMKQDSYPSLAAV